MFLCPHHIHRLNRNFTRRSASNICIKQRISLEFHRLGRVGLARRGLDADEFVQRIAWGWPAALEMARLVPKEKHVVGAILDTEVVE
jgi:hypothetical protein